MLREQNGVMLWTKGGALGQLPSFLNMAWGTPSNLLPCR